MSKLTDELTQYLDVVNSWGFALKSGALVYISYGTHHLHAAGYRDERAQVMIRSKGEHQFRKFATFRPPSSADKPSMVKESCRAQAAAYVTEHYNYAGEWKLTPYRDAWVPAAAYARAMAKLKEKKANGSTASK